MAAGGGRHVRPRGPRERYSPGTEDERPQLGGELGPDLLQRQVQSFKNLVSARFGSDFYSGIVEAEVVVKDGRIVH